MVKKIVEQLKKLRRWSMWESCLRWLVAAGPTCPAALPSIPSATRPFSFHCTGGTICWRGGWSCLPARSSAAACCLLFARSTEWEWKTARGECKGRGRGRVGVTKREREREREGGREGGRVLCEHKSTCHNPSSQPALETAPNQQLAPVWCQSLSSQSRQPRPAGAIRSADWTKVTG